MQWVDELADVWVDRDQHFDVAYLDNCCQQGEALLHGRMKFCLRSRRHDKEKEEEEGSDSDRKDEASDDDAASQHRPQSRDLFPRQPGCQCHDDGAT